MIHIIKEGTNDKVIFLLHGTGGNERDLLSIAQAIDSQATHVGIRGNVEEHGMLRYFARLSDGKFDARSLAKETYTLHKTILEIINKNNFEQKNITVLGYSNGANIMQSMMKEFELPFENMYLLHPSPTRVQEPFMSQKARVFVSTGANDPYITSEGFQEIERQLKDASIETEVFRHNQGHSLTQEELVAVIDHYKNQ